MSNFKCTECESGTVIPQLRQNYVTKIRGENFTVPEASVGICDSCGAEYFDPKELRRWRGLYETKLEESGFYLSASEVSELQIDLRLTVSDFAKLLGTTRPSVNSWRNRERTTPPMRTADLLMRLVRESLRVGPVDVLDFLCSQAGVQVPRREASSSERRCRVRSSAHASSDRFDRLFQTSGPPRDVPSLSMMMSEHA
jgi:YgiT-type zinc finger domain-containing protein